MGDQLGGTAARYDWNLVSDPVAKNFLSPQNSRYLQKEIKSRGYKVGNMQSLLPYMYEVLSTTVNFGFDPSVMDRVTAFPIEKLNREFLDYVIPIFEIEKCAYSRYEDYMRNPNEMPLDLPISDSAKYQELFYNNRW